MSCNIKTKSHDTKTFIRPPRRTASWAAFAIGITGYFAGLFRSDMPLGEKGYYFTVIMFGLFSAISVQKSVRDRLEGIPVTDLYYGISWFCTILALALLTIGLWNAKMWGSEKGFYAFSYILALFSVIAIQKNTRDSIAAERGKNTKVAPELHS